MAGTILPGIGNGFVGTFLGSEDIYAAGIFNGRQ